MAEELCSKCKGILDRTGSPKYCKSCWATYQREHRATAEGRAEMRGYAQGARAMKEAIIASAEGMGSGYMNGYEVADIVRGMDAPEPA